MSAPTVPVKLADGKDNGRFVGYEFCGRRVYDVRGLYASKPDVGLKASTVEFFDVKDEKKATAFATFDKQTMDKSAVEAVATLLPPSKVINENMILFAVGEFSRPQHLPLLFPLFNAVQQMLLCSVLPSLLQQVLRFRNLSLQVRAVSIFVRKYLYPLFLLQNQMLRHQWS